MSTAGEKWSDNAAAYATRITQVTGQGGQILLDLIDSIKPFNDDSKVFETGAGTGVTTGLLRDRNAEMPITAGDPAAGMLEELKKRNLTNVNTLILDAAEDHTAKSISPGCYTHALSTYVLQFVVPNEQAAVNEMYKLLESGGVIGNTMWTKTLIGEPWNIACKNLDPNFEPVTLAFSDAVREPEDLESRYKAAGFVDVQSKITELSLNFPSAENYADYFINSKNPPFMSMMSSWKGNMDDVKEEMIKVVKEKYDNGKFLMVSAAVVGRKP